MIATRLASVAAAWLLVGGLSSNAADAPDFAHDVRPMMKQYCFGCHGPDTQKSGLRLDQRAAAMAGGDSGDPAIVPGRGADSPLLRYVTGEIDGLVMPPADSGKPRLTGEQVALLRSWIDAGAEWPDALAGDDSSRQPLWSLAPLTQPQLPADAATAHPIDAFVRAKLPAGLPPAPAADWPTLIRRLSYDLTGLPPTSEAIAVWESEAQRIGAPKACEALIEQLLASPRYGEHWARHWLDVVQYADTHGNDHDFARPNAWPYRDYVIRSLNDDKPYARLVAEQVAGDVLFPEDPQATVAIGMLAAGPWDDTLMVTVREDTVDHRLAQVLDRDNMVSSVMSTFQSLTVHCARCHNHKFDPISQREYYGLQAVFAGVDRADRPVDLDPAVHTRRRELLARKGAIATRDPALVQAFDESAIAQRADEESQRQQAWQALEVASVVSTAEPDKTRFARLDDGSWLATGARADKDTFVITARSDAKGIRGLRLEVLPDDSLPMRGPGRYDNGNFHLTEFRVSALAATGPTPGAAPLAIARAWADHAEDGQPLTTTTDGKLETYWGAHPRYGEPHAAVYVLTEPVGFDGGTVLTIRLEQNGKTGHQIGRFCLSFCTDELALVTGAPSAALANLLKTPPGERSGEQRREIAWLMMAADVERELASLPPPSLVYAVTRDFVPRGSFKPAPQPRPIHLLLRGDINKPAELVGPAALSCLPDLSAELGMSPTSDEAERRAALARWLADSRNVLTWRSIVNRVWHYHFGRGLVDTPNDFGHMGSAPSHPELLDWLAVWFRDEAHGSLKQLHRLIVSSETYRQAAASGAAIDADNRWLARMSRRRLTAEELRDSVLQLSGALDLTMGGPAVVQFVHRDAATFMPADGSPAFVDYEAFDPAAAANRRRAIYRFLFRTIPDPLLDAFDCPDGGATTPARLASSTPVQALALWNNGFIIKQSELIAERIAQVAATPDEQIKAACRQVLLREPRPAEQKQLADYCQRHGLANLVQVLISSNEFVFVE